MLGVCPAPSGAAETSSAGPLDLLIPLQSEDPQGTRREHTSEKHPSRTGTRCDTFRQSLRGQMTGQDVSEETQMFPLLTRCPQGRKRGTPGSSGLLALGMSARLERTVGWNRERVLGEASSER